MDAIKDAATAGDVVALRSALALGDFPNPETKSEELGRLLETTVLGGHLTCFELLLSSVTPQDFTGSDGQTLLHIVSRKAQYLPYLERLVTRGASLETLNIYTETPLHIACLHENLQCVQYLVGRGANVNPRAYEDDTPLHHACHGGCVDIVELLLLNGGAADLEAENIFNQRPLYMACQEDNLQCVQLLLDRGVDTDALSEDGESFLTIALLNENFEIFHLLLQSGANPNAQDISGSTYLHRACEMDDGTQFVEALITSGANLDTTDDKGRTPLSVVCAYDSLESLDLLIRAGANATIDNDDGNTPLHIAVTSRSTDPSTQLEIVDRLLESGCNPLIRNGALLRPNDVAVHPQLKRRLEEAVWNWGR